VSLGTESFKGITSISNNLKNVNFYDYLWKEIEMTVENKFNEDQLLLTFKNTDFIYIALPHPSLANPLSNLLPKLVPIINWVKEKSDM